MEQVKEFKTVFEIKGSCRVSINDDMMVIEDKLAGMMFVNLKSPLFPPDASFKTRLLAAIAGANLLSQLAIVAGAIEGNLDIDKLKETSKLSLDGLNTLYITIENERR